MVAILEKILGFLAVFFVAVKIRDFKRKSNEELSYLNLFKNSDLRAQFNILHRTWEYLPEAIPKTLVLNEVRKFPIDIDFSNIFEGTNYKDDFLNFLNGDLFYLYDTANVNNIGIKDNVLMDTPFDRYGDDNFSKSGIRLLWDFGKELKLEFPVNRGGWRYDYNRKLYFPAYVYRYRNFVAFYNTDKVLNLTSTYIENFNAVSYKYHLTAVFEFHNHDKAVYFEKIFNYLLNRMLIKFS